MSAQIFGQALLQRHPSKSGEEFTKYYIEHHGRLVLPYFLDCGVLYYAQIHDLRWASETSRLQYSDIDLEEWDAAAECAFGPTGPPTTATSSPTAQKYYSPVILPDERRFLKDEALKHMRVLEQGSVVGRRVEFIVDGKVVVEGWRWAEEEWARVREGGE